MSLAHTSYATARGFCQSADLMMTNPAHFQVSNDSSFVLGFHHLIGFSVELYLKALLQHIGFSVEQLRKRKFGHNLSSLNVACMENGIEIDSAHFLCEYLKPHERFEYRYSGTDISYMVCPLDYVFYKLGALDTAVDHQIGASAALGRLPRAGWQFPDGMKQWRFD